MNIERLFGILKNSKKISRKELFSCGADDNYINSCIDNEILTPINDNEYKIDNVDELVYYGRYLLGQKRYDDANSIFLCAYVTDPDNFNANYQLFYRNLVQKKEDNIFKHFDFVYKGLIEQGRENDANYLLFLLGNIYGVPDKYKRDLERIEEYDILLEEDNNFARYENTLRRHIFRESYYDANSMVDKRFDYKTAKDRPFEDIVEKELILKWLIKHRKFNKTVDAYVADDNFKELKEVLDKEKNNRFLTRINKYLLKVVNSYLEIEKTNIAVKSTYNGNDTFAAIDNNNYKLALRLLEKFQNEKGTARESYLAVMLKKIVILIDKIEEKDGLKYLIDAVAEMRNGKEVLTDSEKQSLDSKVNQLHHGRSAFLLEPMSKEKRNLVHEYINQYDDIATFSIGLENNRRVVLRYKPYVAERVDVFEVNEQAIKLYKRGKYREAAACYELLLKLGRPRDVIYGSYGLTLLRMNRRKEALDYLEIATIMSKEHNGKLDYTDIIETIKYPQAKEERKPRVVVEEEEFEDNKESKLEDEFINDLIGLTQEGEISLIDACKKLNMSEEDINYVKLLYARDCYYLGHDSIGDTYFKQVEKSKAKNKKVKDLYKEIQVNKKYYRKRLDSDKNQLIFRKK